MAIIDFHSHILPGIDDGSKDMATSIHMLDMSQEQGVDILLFTSHFYASRDRVENFLEKRQRAYNALCERLTGSQPRFLLGAEVAFFKGISRAEKLDCLTVEGTDLLLLEMPFAPWKSADIREVAYIIEERGYRVLLAHLERYLDMPENKSCVRELLELPVSVQINAESLLDWRQRRRLVRMFQAGQAHVLGSDCHGIHHRKPNLAAGRSVLEKRLGSGFLDQMDRTGLELLRLS